MNFKVSLQKPKFAKINVKFLIPNKTPTKWYYSLFSQMPNKRLEIIFKCKYRKYRKKCIGSRELNI